MIKFYNPSEKKLILEDTTHKSKNMYYDPETGVTPYSHISSSTSSSKSEVKDQYGIDHSLIISPHGTASSNSITFFGITLTYAEVLLIFIIIIVIVYVFLRRK